MKTLGSSPGDTNSWAQNTNTQLTQIAELRILIDWLGFTFTADGTRVEHVLQWFETYLNIPRQHFKKGRRYYQGYADSFVFENINIYYNGADNQGVHVDITGQGCRYIDVHFQKLQIQDEKMLSVDDKIHLHSWYDLLTLLYYTDDVKFTRLDVAGDDYHGYLNAQYMFDKCLAGEFTMKFKQWRPDGQFGSDGKTNGISLYFGSSSSDIQIVVYEKNKQLGLDYHWTRIELRLGKKRANNFVKEIINSELPLGYHFGGVIKSYISFRVKGEDKNKSRWLIAPWWENFLRGIPKLKLTGALPDRSIVKSRQWVDSQVSRTIARLYFAYQDLDETWLNEILKEGMEKLNDDDLRMIEEFRRIYGKKESRELVPTQ